MNKQQQGGFTLIELIIVIVILGILAVTAAPRFIDIQSEARVSTLEGVRGALQGASQLVFAKAAISGVQRLPTADPLSEVTVGNATVQTNFGYPDATIYEAIETVAGTDGVDSFVDLDRNQLVLAQNPANTAEFRITFAGEDSFTNNCYVSYTNANALGDVPAITSVISDC